MKRSDRNQTQFTLAATCIMLAGAALRLWDLDAGSLWYDEYLTALRVDASMRALFDNLAGVVNQLPLYYLLLVPFPTSNDLLLRYPSALFGLLGIALMIGTTYRLLRSPGLALVAGALLAFNPYHIWLSRLARNYTLLVALSLLVSYLFLRILDAKASRRDWVGFALGSVAVCLTHHVALLLVLAEFVLLVAHARPDRARLRRWAAVQAVACGVLLLWTVYQSQQPDADTGIGWIPQPTLADLPLTLWNMTVGYPLDAAWYVAAGAVLAVGLLLWGSVRVLRWRRDDPRFMYALVLAWLPLVGMFLVSVVVHPAYVDRYFALSLPAMLLLLAYALTRLPRVLRRITLAGLLVVMAANVVGELARGDHVRAEWAAVMRRVETQRQPDEAFLMPSYLDGVVGFHMRDPAALEAARGTLVGTALGPVALFGPPAQGDRTSGVWVVLRTVNESVHRIGRMPEYGPMENLDEPFMAWLHRHRSHITGRWHYAGAWVFHVQPVTVLPHTE